MASEKINVSFSGGRSSALMLKILIENNNPEDLIVTFANTGKEREETLQFVKDCQDHFGIEVVWLEARFKPFIRGEIKRDDCLYFEEVTFETASRDGKPFEDMLNLRRYLPNSFHRFCTELLKVKIIKMYLQSIGVEDYRSALGIRKDEPNRYFKLKKEDPNRIFPLWDFGVNSIDVRRFWENQPFDLNLKSYEGNCDLCFMKGINIRRTIARENPALCDWWIRQEERVNATFYKGVSVKEIRRQAKSNKRFPMAKDELEMYESNPALFGSVSCFCGD